MYDFHYNFIKKNFDVKLLFTDTDSLTYEIKSENVYVEVFKWKDLFGFSKYPKDSKFFDETNKRAIGKIKDEFLWSDCNRICWIKLKNTFYEKN